MEPHRKRAEVCFDEAGSRGETEFPLIASEVENAADFEHVWGQSGKKSAYLCVFNVICMAAYQLSMAWLTILGTG